MERLKEDKGYEEDLGNIVKAISSVQNTVSGLIEALPDALELSNDPKALINAFRHKMVKISQGSSKHMFSESNKKAEPYCWRATTTSLR